MTLPKDSELAVQTPGKTLSEYYQLGLWRCPASPSGAHHWLIDGSGMGQCKYCGERRQFGNSGVPDYGDGADSG